MGRACGGGRRGDNSAMTEARTVSVSIARSPGRVYDYLADPARFPEWSVFVTGMRQDGNAWIATTPGGEVRMTFTPRNAFGILDHRVEVNPQLSVQVPLRVVPNGEGSEVLFTVFRLSGMSDTAFEADIGLVRTDLGRLKAKLEG